MRFAVTFGLALALGHAAVPAAAQSRPASETDAARAFSEGQQAFDAGDYRRAALAFEAAYAKKPHHSPLWNAARSWQRAGEEVRAANLIERYLADAPRDAPARTEANATLVEIRQHVGRFDVHAPPATTPDLDGAPLASSTIYVAPGEHVLAVTTPGKPDVRRRFTIAAGQVISVNLEAPREDGAPAHAGARRLPPLAVVVAGGFVLTGVVFTVIAGLDTVHKRDAFLGDMTEDRLRDVKSSEVRTNVVLGTTIGLGVLTAALAALFVDWRATPPRPDGAP